ncbi:MAG: hypothetical protein AABX33_04880 [Nanoarchaeota archaeon]
MATINKTITIGGKPVIRNGSGDGLVGKVDAFTGYISKSRIESPTIKIPKPDGAHYLRTKSGEVLFFAKESGITNHFIPVPEHATAVTFPYYREHGLRHTIYGDPFFHYS